MARCFRDWPEWEAIERESQYVCNVVVVMICLFLARIFTWTHTHLNLFDGPIFHGLLGIAGAKNFVGLSDFYRFWPF